MRAVLAIVMLICSISAQSMNTASVVVKSIRRAAKSTAQKKPVIQIELVNSQGFYVGGLYWCLYVGDFEASPAGGPSDNKILIFSLSKENWKKLKDGEPLVLTWGCSGPSGHPLVKPFAYLNKKMLTKN